jgi:arylsulfatase A-like enzyme/Tfp pilus assembly protein PilF
VKSARATPAPREIEAASKKERLKYIVTLLSRSHSTPDLHRASTTLAVFVALGCGRAPAKVARPNVLVVTIDTLRADRVGCYGFRLAHTPRIDRLAHEGVRVTNAIASAPITAPSHASILTGLYPPAHGVRDNGAFRLADDVVTLPERLHARGWATQAFVSAAVLDHRYNLAQGFDAYDDRLWSEDDPLLFMIRERPGARTADRALEWIRKRPRGRPFFLWVHLFDPHQPYQAPPAQQALAPTPYDAEVAAADAHVGRILDGLARAGVLDDTLVVVTADHGESLGEHGERTHGVFVYESTVHVPLVLRWPRVLPRGRVYRGPVRSIDIAPTILSALGVRIDPPVQGVDLLAALAGRAEPPALTQYSESLLSEVGFGMAPLHAIREGTRTWIRAPRPELYDRARDPGEARDLAARQPDVARRLDAALGRVLEESRRMAHDSDRSPLDQETIEMLRSLGYVGDPATRDAVAGMDPKDGLRIHELLEEARHAARRGEWTESMALLHSILEETPGNLSALGTLALCQVRLGRVDEAADTYRRSLAIDPKQQRALVSLAGIEIDRGNWDDAALHLREALRQSPAYVEAMVQLGFVELERGNEAEARRWYDRAIAADPGFPRAWQRYGDLFFARGEYGRALDYYRRAIDVQPDLFAAIIQAGVSARRMGDSSTAIRYYERAAHLRPDSWIPPYNLACAQALAGDHEEALARLAEAITRGLADLPLLDNDPDLASLRPDPRLETLRARIRSPPPKTPTTP